MSSFNSERAKNLAQITVNKLIGQILPDLIKKDDSAKRKVFSKAEIVDMQVKKKTPSASEVRRKNLKNKKSKNKSIRKSLKESQDFTKLAKYNIIKQRKANNKLTVEEEKYLKKLVRKNAVAVNKLSEFEDYETKSEFNKIQRDILRDSLKEYDNKKKRKQSKKAEFDDKIRNGLISYPGLTPGLAPVDLEDSDEE
ncbi:uncharacterized protein PRCAT00001950001 [Priceomyces carsonii]|uniref:uncharacterized protein n=1 Tax=Priceomyces carsonii TaxID=28549 RepID=UPI002ED917C4|nr:unnamed protein product [Priceomyces carsonii]